MGAGTVKGQSYDFPHPIALGVDASICIKPMQVG